MTAEAGILVKPDPFPVCAPDNDVAVTVPVVEIEMLGGNVTDVGTTKLETVALLQVMLLATNVALDLNQKKEFVLLCPIKIFWFELAYITTSLT